MRLDRLPIQPSLFNNRVKIEGRLEILPFFELDLRLPGNFPARALATGGLD
jgi:hypothetical protein